MLSSALPSMATLLAKLAVFDESSAQEEQDDANSLCPLYKLGHLMFFLSDSRRFSPFLNISHINEEYGSVINSIALRRWKETTDLFCVQPGIQPVHAAS